MSNRWMLASVIALLSWCVVAAEFPGWTGMGVTRGRGEQRPPWLHVRHVTPGGPAEAAGIRAQDLIMQIDGKPVAFKADRDVLRYFNTLKPGQKVKFTVRRTEGEMTLTVTVAQMPENMRERWKQSQRRVESKSAN